VFGEKGPKKINVNEGGSREDTRNTNQSGFVSFRRDAGQSAGR
jgi:hypothetical protein